MKFIKILLFLIMIFSGIFWILSYFYEPNLSANIKIDPLVYHSPQQTPTSAPPLEIKKADLTYKITPVFNYAMDVLVISHGDGWYIDEDPLNTDDICVIWGKTNTKPEIISKIQSKNISYACLPRAKGNDNKLYQNMKFTELSNNHILPATGQIEKKLDTIKRGDQVHLKGYLANYTAIGPDGQKFSRTTSTSREDIDESGNYKCETIYLTDFSIITPYRTFTTIAYTYAPYVALISFGILFIFWITVMIQDSRSARPIETTSDSYSQAQTPEQIKAEIEQKLREKSQN